MMKNLFENRPKLNEAPSVGGSKWFAHLPIGGGGVSWNFDAEFKFAKIQNPHVEGWGGAHGILMLSSNWL